MCSSDLSHAQTRHATGLAGAAAIIEFPLGNSTKIIVQRWPPRFQRQKDFAVHITGIGQTLDFRIEHGRVNIRATPAARRQAQYCAGKHCCFDASTNRHIVSLTPE